jgi:hypothetical protein
MVGCTRCGANAVVQWQRRPTAPELADAVAAEKARLALAQEINPADVVSGPLPTTATTTVPVYACVAHAISFDLGHLVHAANCSGPNSAALPKCDCTPEVAVQGGSPSAPVMPAGW